jgi:hypothetical protein
MALSFINLGVSQGSAVAPDIADSSDSSSYVTTSWTPPSGLLIAFVLSASGGEVATITGNNLTWELVVSEIYKSATRAVTMFAAKSAGATPGVSTINFGGAQLGCCAAFCSVDGADLTKTLSQMFFVDTVTGVGATSATITDVFGPRSGENRMIACFAHDASEATTPRASWTELDDIPGTLPDVCFATQYRGDQWENVCSASWVTSSDYCGIAAQVVAAPNPISAYTPLTVGSGARW